MLYYSGYYCSQRVKPVGFWQTTLANLVRDWKNGKCPILITDDFYPFERN